MPSRKGSANRRSVALVQLAHKRMERKLQRGRVPVEVLLDQMRYYDERAQIAQEKLEAFIQSHDLSDTNNLEKSQQLFKQMLALHEVAADRAERCAPYIHARVSPLALSQVHPDTPGKGEITEEMSAKDAALAYQDTLHSDEGDVAA